MISALGLAIAGAAWWDRLTLQAPLGGVHQDFPDVWHWMKD
jgi:hypothetical protein